MQAIPTNIPGVSTVGLVKIRNNEALALEDAERQAFLTSPEEVAIPALSGYLRSCWGKAKMAKIPIEQQMLRNLRQRYGIYENDKFAAIQKMGGLPDIRVADHDEVPGCGGMDQRYPSACRGQALGDQADGSFPSFLMISSGK